MIKIQKRRLLDADKTTLTSADITGCPEYVHLLLLTNAVNILQKHGKRSFLSFPFELQAVMIEITVSLSRL